MAIYGDGFAGVGGISLRTVKTTTLWQSKIVVGALHRANQPQVLSHDKNVASEPIRCTVPMLCIICGSLAGARVLLLIGHNGKPDRKTTIMGSRRPTCVGTRLDSENGCASIDDQSNRCFRAGTAAGHLHRQ
jgi:hypothetical protein